MKRKIACLLTAVLLCSTVLPSYASNTAYAMNILAESGVMQQEIHSDTFQEEESSNTVELQDEAEISQNQENKSEAAVMQGNSEVKPDTLQDSTKESAKSNEEVSMENSDSNSIKLEDSEELEILKELQDTVELGKIGQVNVSIGAALILQRSVEFTVSLTDAQQNTQTNKVILGGENFNDCNTSFNELAEGTYILSVSAQGFATYSQEITVEKKAYNINLMTGFLGGVTYEKDIAHPGVLLIGDVTGDGINNEADKNALVDAVDKGEAVEAMDLNGDGVVDLVDLEYLTKGHDETRDITAKIEQSISTAAIQLKEAEGTNVEGDLSNLLKSEESVTLTPKNGKEISQENPVSLDFYFAEAEDVSVTDGVIIETGNDNPIREAVITVAYTDENGEEQTAEVPVTDGVQYLLRNTDVYATRDAQGNIQVHLGSQIAIKKVTLAIMGMRNNNNLAEISKVEFVNGMEDRIPEPEMDIPQNLIATAGSEQFSLTWDPCVNVTGYEVLIKQEEKQETVMLTNNAVDITSFGGKGVENYKKYFVKVQSVNGTWRSGYGEEVMVMPKPTGKPDKPDNVKAQGKYKTVVVSWKLMKDTLTYNLYYKKSSDSEYQKIEGIEQNGYTLSDLEDLTAYTVYVTGVNEFGESSPSLPSEATTTDINPPVVPKYHLINTGNEGEKSAHIINVTSLGQMIDSPLDTEAGSAWGAVDNNPASYYLRSTWDDGGYNNLGNNGLIVEFDQAYKMDTIAFYEVLPQSPSYAYVKVRYWDENGTAATVSGLSLQKKTDSDNRSYYQLKLSAPINAKKIQIGLARYVASGTITISEIYFYHYDTLMEEIMGLYEDNLHTVLRADVTQQTIDDLRVKINTIDEVSGEYHPDRVVLERELQTAEEILNNKQLCEPVIIHNGISTRDVGRGFGGLNAWQPLGITAAAKEEIMIYVGHNTKKTGDATNLQLVATQYHAEASALNSGGINLKVGANKITIPKIWTTTGYESGGALYIQYTGNGGNDYYAVRVSGGVKVPKLDLYQVTDEAERLARTKAYVEELETYVSQMEAKHNEVHKNSENKEVAYDFDARNCILGASDILLNTMMFSLPAPQILAGSGSGTTEEKAQRMLNSMDAMEDMMYLFYQHKGLNKNATDAVNQIPKGHQNVRYQRMFSGAFMYASGNHIGIEWPESAGMITSEPIVSDSEGRYQSGRYFGWGIAHEIGHCINQGAYAVAEVTNNYFAQLAKSRDTNQTTRFQYQNIYDKVTSGTKGPASNVFTQLGMYWQLHLAYDKGYNFKTYENYEEQLANLFYARVDTYARTPAKAPAPGGVALTLTGGSDQALMRLACAAAEKNILEFFERWGKTPDEETKAYAEQFEKETRAIYYANDDSRVYALQGGTSVLGTEGKVDAVGDDVSAKINENAANQIDFTLSHKDNIPDEDVLGYEIMRYTISGGKIEREPAGFTTTNTFSDSFATLNNRTVTYEITVIDKYLNRSAVKTLEPLKIQHDGSQNKAFWTISTQDITPVETVEPGEGTEDSPCAPEPENPAQVLIDHDVNTAYAVTLGENAEVTLEFNKALTITGFKYTSGEAISSGDYEIQIRSEETEGGWLTVEEGTFSQDKVNTIYFANQDKKYVSTYVTDALKLKLKNQTGKQVTIAELDVLGVTGDNVDFRRTQEDKTAVIGKLKTDYKYASEEGHVIPAGSIVFTGSYKGNPAYNVVILYDQDGNIVGGTNEEGALIAHQIILADVPDEGLIQNVSDGTWIYWIEPEQQAGFTGVSKVRAELYRVNNALTNEGQRLVSDSLFENVPEVLPEIEFTNNETVEEQQ